MEKNDFTITGFKVSAEVAGLKKNSALDMALIYSEKEAVAAAVFTANKVKAAPVLVSMEHIRNSRARAIIANAGNANACTGPEGLKNARGTAGLVADELGIKADEVLVASTGVIGAQLNMDRVKKAVPGLVRNLSAGGLTRAAEAIMTTDSFPKISSFSGEAGGVPYHVIGIAKGAGMIMPDMATMLCFVLTDISIEETLLKKALIASVEKSFNRITVDGDTSTNDTVMILANGAAGNEALSPEDYQGFVEGLGSVTRNLSTMIVRDGEGATKLVYLKVTGAASPSEAITAARTVANSSLVKTAFFGQDPNWGRIIAALGRSGISMKEENISIYIDDVKIVEGGMGAGSDQEKKAAEKMLKREFSLTIHLNNGDYEDQVITCDLTHDYVSINADYRT